jgi:transposase-like protein
MEIGKGYTMSRRIAKEIKDEVIAKVQAGGRVADLALQYGISTKTIYGW